ncbi:molybdenum cofactor guanylyltransferase [Pedobacter sp. MR2016-24]|uniref:molybdenum cofactor guanylyltransferase n=1 Tax=Pedobacter sp. MR2016-24 TaxID=2994466 RepID=UPI002246B5C6|nr:molybdenum cofactor guanylyltransferase [Pedobacter sp. MR2016-24]MCX2483995.1 molybdenum cofactor guanylyltransferase [Pedobacter sp. MR2016-24]
MLGIILCGGQSLRMGSDKGLLTYQDKTWAQLAGDKLHKLVIPVKISVNAVQQVTYTKHFSTEQLLADDAAIDMKGPLLGTLSAHMSAPEEDLFLLACDLPLITNRLLNIIFDAYKTLHDYDAYIFNNAGKQEPLCGIYKSRGLKKILLMFQNNEIEKPSMKFVLQQLNVLESRLSAADEQFFNNFNFPSEMSPLV